MVPAFPLVAIPAQDEALRAEARSFARQYVETMPPEVRARSWSGFDADFSRQVAERGWLGLTLPKAHGGRGRGHFARFVIAEEFLAAGAPVGAHWIADRQSGPLIAKYGSEAQKLFYLPKICRAEAFFCIGMSEPNAGSDLSSVGTRAEKTGTGWKLNGQKIWTTNAHRMHFAIVLARTSGQAGDRHVGLSQLIVDLSLPGVTIRPIRDLAGDEHFAEVFFHDVELDEDALIGTEGAGWQQVTAELGFERSGPERLYSSMVLLEEWLALLRSDVSADAFVDTTDTVLVGRLLSRLAVLRELSLSIADMLARDENPAVAAALVKDLGTELEQTIPAAIADALARKPDVPVPQSLARTLAYVVQISPSFSLRGGTREILRGMIARGLGLR